MAASRKLTTRAASFSDSWRALQASALPVYIKSVEFASLSCFEDGIVDFLPGINAVVGGNGAGKSTIAATIAAALSGQIREFRIGHDLRVTGSRLRLEIIRDGETHRILVTQIDGVRVIDSDQTSIEFSWLDPTFSVEIQKPIFTDPNFQEVAQISPVYVLDTSQLEEVSYIIGKEYSAVEIIEISEYEDRETFPYFRVTSSNISYDSKGMGQGELALFVLFWALNRAADRSVFVIEEPETHLSPRAQAALMDVLARRVVTNKICVILTTHSPTIIKKLPMSHVKLIAHQGGRSVVVNDASRPQIENLLGQAVQLSGGFFVEDEGARSLLEASLERFAPDACWSFEVALAQGQGALQKMMDGLPSGKPWLKMRAIFDGDKRNQISSANFQLPIFFLPGDTDPDHQCKEILRRQGSAKVLADELGISETRALTALGFVEGLNYHDWPTQLATFLQIEPRRLRRTLSKLWLRDEKNAVEAKLLIDQLISSTK